MNRKSKTYFIVKGGPHLSVILSRKTMIRLIRSGFDPMVYASTFNPEARPGNWFHDPDIREHYIGRFVIDGVPVDLTLVWYDPYNLRAP